MRRLDNLQIMRGIAAGLVVIDHSLLAAAAHDPNYIPYQGFAATIGRMGVNIFFIISGFIMVHSTESTRQLDPGSRVRSFAWKRATRLVPLYWLATLVQIAVGADDGTHFSIGHIVRSLAFLPNFADMGDERMPPVLGVGWTLNYEVLFYCIFAATLLLPRRIGLLACISAITAMVSAGVLGMRYVGNGAFHRIFFFYTFKNMLFFAIGISIAMGQRFLPKLVRGWPMGAAMALMVSGLAFFRVMGFNDGNPVWLSISLVICTAVIVLAVSDHSINATTRYRTILHIGNASFSTYLFHAMLLAVLAPVAARIFGTAMGPVLILTGPVLCLTIGSIIHIFVEIPLTKLFRGARGGPPVTHGTRAATIVLEP